MVSTATAPRRRHSADDRRAEVVAAATREFAERGYQAASTAAIARRAGISQPYIYALFPSKQHLFLAVHDSVIDGIHRAFAAAAAMGTTPAEKLEAMGSTYHGLIADRYALLAQLQTYTAGDALVQEHVARAYRGLYEEVRRRSGASPVEVSLFFACGMFANVTTALGLEDLCAPLFKATDSTTAPQAS